MLNINKIKTLAKEQGISLSFICGKIGVAKVYFNDIQKHGRKIPEERLALIADILKTTPEYLCDKTEEKRKPPQNRELSEDEIYMLKLFHQISDEDKKMAKSFLQMLLKNRNEDSQ